MKKFNFDVVYKISVLILLVLILTIDFLRFRTKPQSSSTPVLKNEVGRFKEIKVPITRRWGDNINDKTLDKTVILDTVTGETHDPF